MVWLYWSYIHTAAEIHVLGCFLEERLPCSRIVTQGIVTNQFKGTSIVFVTSSMFFVFLPSWLGADCLEYVASLWKAQVWQIIDQKKSLATGSPAPQSSTVQFLLPQTEILKIWILGHNAIFCTLCTYLHEILNILSQDAIFTFQFQVLLLHLMRMKLWTTTFTLYWNVDPHSGPHCQWGSNCCTLSTLCVRSSSVFWSSSTCQGKIPHVTSSRLHYGRKW